MKDFEEFKEALAERESNGEYGCKNKFGFLGKYQFGKARLYDFGLSVEGYHPKGKPVLRYITEEEFLDNRELQDVLFMKHVELYANSFSKKYKAFINKTYTHDSEPFEITLSGMVAVAHLLGPGGLKDFLNGTNKKDGLGTEASEYAMKFSNYELEIRN